MFKIINQLSVRRANGGFYNYTIDVFGFGILNILHITAMMDMEIIDGLRIIESMGGYVGGLMGLFTINLKKKAPTFMCGDEFFT